jgi:hypothetical protein
MAPASDDTPFADLLAVSRRHREDHGCCAYPYDKGALLRVLAACWSAPISRSAATAKKCSPIRRRGTVILSVKRCWR